MSNWNKETYGDFGVQHRYGDTPYVAYSTDLTGRDNRWAITRTDDEDINAELAAIGERVYVPTKAYAEAVVEILIEKAKEDRLRKRLASWHGSRVAEEREAVEQG